MRRYYLVIDKEGIIVGELIENEHHIRDQHLVIVEQGELTELSADAALGRAIRERAYELRDAEARPQSNFDDVGDFHERFELVNVTHGGVGDRGTFDQQLFDFRHGFMQEELQEFKEGWEDGNLSKMADALVDLVYVAMGTAHFLGLPWQEIWDEVQRANMTKERAKSAEDSGAKTGRHHHFDVVKPLNFVPPDVRGILETHGFQCTWPVEARE